MHNRNTNARRLQNPKAAAQRLAQVMSNQSADDEDEEEDDDLYDFDSSRPSGVGLAGGRPATRRPARNPSPMSARASVDPQPPSSRPALSARTTISTEQQDPSTRSPYSRPALSARTTKVEQQASSTRSPSYFASSVDQPPSARSLLSNRSPTYFRTSQSKSAEAEEVQPLSARFSTNASNSYVEQPTSARFANLGVKMVPPTAPISFKSAVSVVSAVLPPENKLLDRSRDKRMSLDFGTFKYKEATNQQSSSALQDEVDMLQEENDSLLEKLRLSEERFEETEARTRQLEKQIASLGDGVSIDASLLTRKEAELQKREAALKVATQTYGGSNDEILTFRIEAENARSEAKLVKQQLGEVEDEVNSIRKKTRKMILTQEEMEEVVLKRCWLARCWSHCVRYGIHSEIAGVRNEFWSSLVSRPVEFILSVGKKAKDENITISNELWVQNGVTKTAGVESMLLVEKGLRELTLLKVEEAMAITMARKRPQNKIRSNTTDEMKLPIECQTFIEAFELSQEECEDVLIKRAWLTYFWRRAKNYRLEPEITEERLQFWINKGTKTPNSNDAVEVERGLMELRRLGIESKLWEESRRLVDPESGRKILFEIRF